MLFYLILLLVGQCICPGNDDKFDIASNHANYLKLAPVFFDTSKAITLLLMVTLAFNAPEPISEEEPYIYGGDNRRNH